MNTRYFKGDRFTRAYGSAIPALVLEEMSIPHKGKTTWNYRVVVERYEPTGDDFYSVREVYYSKRGKIQAWTEPVRLYGLDSVMDLLVDLTLIAKDVQPAKLRRRSPHSLLRLRTKRTGKQVLEEVYA